LKVIDAGRIFILSLFFHFNPFTNPKGLYYLRSLVRLGGYAMAVAVSLSNIAKRGVEEKNGDLIV
jgi:hypothetical protein